MRWAVILGLVSALWPHGAFGHDLLNDPDKLAAQLREVGRLQDQIAAAGVDDGSAQAHLQLGLILVELVDMLGADRAAHDGAHGLAATILVDDLAARGFTLEYAPMTRRYRTIVAPFARAVALAPDGAAGAEAQYHLTTAWFYEQPPMFSPPVDAAALRTLLDNAGEAAAFVDDHPTFEPVERRQEMTFIAATLSYRAYKATSESRYVEPARALLERYLQFYPTSLRIGAVRLMLDDLSGSP